MIVVVVVVAATAAAAMPMKSSSHVSGFLFYTNIYVSFHQSLCHFVYKSASSLLYFNIFYFYFSLYLLFFVNCFAGRWCCGGWWISCRFPIYVRMRKEMANTLEHRPNIKYRNITPISRAVVGLRSLRSDRSMACDCAKCAMCTIQNSNHC